MKRSTRILLWIPAGIVLIIVILVLVVLSRPVQTMIAHRVLADLNHGIRGTFSVGSVHVNPGGAVILNGVRLTDPEGVTVLSFASLNGHIDLWGLARRTVRVDGVDIEDLRANILIDTSGTTNLERALAPRDTTPKPPPDTTRLAAWIVQLDDIKISGGPALIANPSDTLVYNEVWTLDAGIRFKDRKVDYTAEFDSPQQVHLKTEGSGVFGDTLRDVQGTLALRVDSSYAGGYYYIPARTFGRLVSETTYRQRGDSMDVKADVSSTLLGDLQGEGTMLFPPGILAGHGDFQFDRMRPASLWKDTSDLEISGRLQFTKDTTADLVNGWDVHLQVRDSRYAQYALEQGELHIVTRDSTASIQGDVRTGSGQIRVDAHVIGFIPRTSAVRAELQLSKVDLHKFISLVPDSLSPLTGFVSVRGHSVTSESARQIAASAYLGQTSFGRYHADTLALRASLIGNHFLVDTLAIFGYGTEIRLESEGELKGDATYSVRAHIPDVRALEPLIATVADSLDSLRGDVSLDLSGSFRLADSAFALTAEGYLALDGISYGQTSIRRAEVQLMHFDMTDMTLGFSLTADTVIAAGRLVDSLSLRASGGLDQFTASVDAWMKADTAVAHAEFTARREGETEIVTLDSLHVLAFGITAASEGQSVLQVSRDRFEVDALEVRSDIGVLRASGYMQRHGDQDMTFELSGVRTGDLSRLLGHPLPESTSNIRVQFTGTETNLVGDLSLTADSVIYDGNPIADQLSVQATATDEITLFNGVFVAAGDTAAAFGGQVPLQISFASGVVLLKDSAMTGRAKIYEQRLDGFSRFLPSGTKIGGFIAGDVTFTGTPVAPQWQGDFTIHDGHYRDARSGVDYDQIAIHGQLVNDSLHVSEFKIRSVGEVTGSGSALMSFPLPKRLDLNLRLKRFQIMDNQQMRIRATGDMAVRGPLNQLHATGDLEFDEAIYRITQATMKNVEEVNVDSVVAVMRGDTLAGRGDISPTAIYRTMSHELFLRIPGNCWIRGAGLNIELAGDLWMYKDSGQVPTLTGQILTRQGRVSLLGREFQVTQGSIRFEGPIGDPQLDILAEYTPPESATTSNPLVVRVYGTVTQTQFEFQNMTPEDAVTALTQGSGSGLAAAATGAATGVATGQLTGALGRWAGLDVLEYRPGTGDGNNLASGTLEVGTYVTERLFVRVKQPVESGKTQRVVNIEYRLLDWLKLRAQQEEQQGSALDLLFQIDWR